MGYAYSSNGGKTTITNCEIKDFELNCSGDVYQYDTTIQEFGSIIGLCNATTISVSNCIVENAKLYDRYRDVYGAIKLSNFYAYSTGVSQYVTKTPPTTSKLYFEETASKITLDSCSEIGGTLAEVGSFWYKATDYNGGIPLLRTFLTWKTVTIKGVGAGVSRVSYANATYTQTTIEIPSNANKTYDSNNAKITIYDRNIYSASSLCHGQFVEWAHSSQTSYTVTYTPILRAIWVTGEWYFDNNGDYIDSVDILINGQTYDQEYNWYYYKEVPCGRHIYFEYSSPYLKRDENLQKTYYQKLTVYYWPEDGSDKIVIAVYTAKAGYAIRDAGPMFEVMAENEGGKATYKFDTVKAFELHNDVSIAVVLEPMTYDGSLK